MIVKIPNRGYVLRIRLRSNFAKLKIQYPGTLSEIKSLKVKGYNI